jgi:chemotaxis-related protein WspB
VERATEMIAKDPADFRPIGITTSAARYLGPVAHDPRGMLQRIDVAALLTAELQAALFPEDAAPVPGPEAVAP